ncbi:MAG: RNA polymerase subunit sigma-70 [Pseudomonadota bacterium]
MTKTLITPAMIAAALLAATPLSAASEADRDQAKANFLEADADADGALTLSEFTTLIDLNASHGLGRAAMIKRLGRYGTAFGRIDADGDKLVTQAELQALAQR